MLAPLSTYEPINTIDAKSLLSALSRLKRGSMGRPGPHALYLSLGDDGRLRWWDVFFKMRMRSEIWNDMNKWTTPMVSNQDFSRGFSGHAFVGMQPLMVPMPIWLRFGRVGQERLQRLKERWGRLVFGWAVCWWRLWFHMVHVSQVRVFDIFCCFFPIVQ